MEPEKKKLLPSQQVVQDYLDSLTEEMRYKACRGKVRQDLKKRVFPHLKPEQKQKYAEDEKAFDNWLTGALKNQRKFVIQPEKGRKDKPKKKVGDPNCFTKENVAKKNQQANTKASKARHEAKNPKRMAKFHGTETKAKWQKKYQTSEKGRATRKKYREEQKKRGKVSRQKKQDQDALQSNCADENSAFMGVVEDCSISKVPGEHREVVQQKEREQDDLQLRCPDFYISFLGVAEDDMISMVPALQSKCTDENMALMEATDDYMILLASEEQEVVQQKEQRPDELQFQCPDFFNTVSGVAEDDMISMVPEIYEV